MVRLHDVGQDGSALALTGTIDRRPRAGDRCPSLKALRGGVTVRFCINLQTIWRPARGRVVQRSGHSGQWPAWPPR
jgi:hypothetical protein